MHVSIPIVLDQEGQCGLAFFCCFCKFRFSENSKLPLSLCYSFSFREAYAWPSGAPDCVWRPHHHDPDSGRLASFTEYEIRWLDNWQLIYVDYLLDLRKTPSSSSSTPIRRCAISTPASLRSSSTRGPPSEDCWSRPTLSRADMNRVYLLFCLHLSQQNRALVSRYRCRPVDHARRRRQHDDDIVQTGAWQDKRHCLWNNA